MEMVYPMPTSRLTRLIPMILIVITTVFVMVMQRSVMYVTRDQIASPTTRMYLWLVGMQILMTTISPTLSIPMMTTMASTTALKEPETLMVTIFPIH